jgi:hypothetical protein
MPVLNAPRLSLWPPSGAGSKSARAARVWMIRAAVPASIAMAPTRGRGVPPPRPRGGCHFPSFMRLSRCSVSRHDSYA